MSVMKHITNDDLAPMQTPFLHSGGTTETLTFRIGEVHAHPASHQSRCSQERRFANCFWLSKWKLQSHKPTPEEHVTWSYHEHSKQVGDLTRALLWRESASSPSVLRDNFWNINVARICNRTNTRDDETTCIRHNQHMRIRFCVFN